MHTRIMEQIQNAEDRKKKQKKTNTNGKSPLYLTQILDISFSFLTPSLLAFRGINQHKIRNQNQPQTMEKQNRHTRWKQEINQKGILL